MANIKSSAKRAEIGNARNARNRAGRTALRTTMKKFDVAVVGGNRDAAAESYKAAVKAVDRAVSKGLLHKNNAAHKKSRMALAMNALEG